jgi:hypothetical protein
VIVAIEDLLGQALHACAHPGELVGHDGALFLRSTHLGAQIGNQRIACIER